MFKVIRSRFGSASLNFAKCFGSPFAERMCLHTSLNAKKSSSPSKFLDPKMGITFKHLFGCEMNKDILFDFINDIFYTFIYDDVEEIFLINPRLDVESAFDKECIIDVYCRDERKKRIILAMQVIERRRFVKRMQYYVAEAYARQMVSGEQYDELEEVMGIAITDFILFPDESKYISKHETRNIDSRRNDSDLNDLSYIFVELPKFTEDVYQNSRGAHKWLYFLKYADKTDEEKMKEIAGNNEMILKAYDQLNRSHWPEDKLKLYDQEEKYMRGVKAAMKEATEIAKRKYAKRMLNEDVGESTIATVTGLEYDEVLYDLD